MQKSCLPYLEPFTFSKCIGSQPLIQTLNLHLDSPRLEIGRRLEGLDGLLELEAVRDQLPEVDDAVLHEPDGLGPRVCVAVLELEVDLARGEAHEGNLHLVLADADDEDLAAELDGLDGAGHARLDARALHGDGGLDAVHEGEDARAEVVGRVAELDLVREQARDEVAREIEAALVDVCDDEGRGAGRFAAQGCDEADGTGAADDDGVTEADARAVHARQCDREGLEHCAVFPS